MEHSDWVAANAIERGMADALGGGDGARFAELLMAAPLYVPDLPAAGSDEEQQIAELLPPGSPYVLAYTSPQTLSWALGELANGWQELDFATLRQRWPDQQHQLAVNPGSPIGVFLPPHGVPELAEGNQSLVAIPEIQQQAVSGAVTQIRQAVLSELAGEQPGNPEPDGAASEPTRDGSGPVLRDDPPANELEVRLRAAVQDHDLDGYITALLATDVLLPTAAAVPDPDRIYDEEGFPWRVFGGEQTPSITVFTSASMLERATVGRVLEHVEVDAIDVLANWPGEQYALCVNPGDVSELILLPGAVGELVLALANALEPEGTGHDTGDAGPR